MKIKIFGLVLLTMIFVENPPMFSHARTQPTNKPIVRTPLIDSVFRASLELEIMTEANLRSLQVLKEQQQLLNSLDNEQ